MSTEDSGTHPAVPLPGPYPHLYGVPVPPDNGSDIVDHEALRGMTPAEIAVWVMHNYPRLHQDQIDEKVDKKLTVERRRIHTEGLVQGLAAVPGGTPGSFVGLFRAGHQIVDADIDGVRVFAAVTDPAERDPDRNLEVGIWAALKDSYLQVSAKVQELPPAPEHYVPCDLLPAELSAAVWRQDGAVVYATRPTACRRQDLRQLRRAAGSGGGAAGIAPIGIAVALFHRVVSAVVGGAASGSAAAAMVVATAAAPSIPHHQRPAEPPPVRELYAAALDRPDPMPRPTPQPSAPQPQPGKDKSKPRTDEVPPGHDAPVPPRATGSVPGVQAPPGTSPSPTAHAPQWPGLPPRTRHPSPAQPADPEPAPEPTVAAAPPSGPAAQPPPAAEMAPAPDPAISPSPEPTPAPEAQAPARLRPHPSTKSPPAERRSSAQSQVNFLILARTRPSSNDPVSADGSVHDTSD